MSKNGTFPKNFQELEEFLRKKVDEVFQPYLDWAGKLLKWIDENSKHLEEVEHVFRYRAIDKVDLKDLNLIASSLVLLQSQQVQMMKLLYKTVNELKDAAFLIALVPSELAWELSETLPKFALPLKERLDAVEKELNRLKKRKEKIKFEVADNIRKVLENMARQLEEAKKAQEKYVA